MVELTVNGQSVEMLSKTAAVKYTRQIADVFDLSAVANSYTNSFNIPKTPNNTKVFERLGIVGDMSSMPYSRVTASLKDDGFPLIQTGWLSVKETNDYYRVSIIDGMIDFFKSVDNKSMGLDLNLSEFDHEKNIETVVDSFANELYKYIIADYNGKNETEVGDDTAINIDYLVPCFSVWKLLERVFDTFGYTFSTQNIEELKDVYITYPKAPSETIESALFADLSKSPYVDPALNDGSGNTSPNNQNNWSSSTINDGTLTGNWIYNIPEDGVYRIEATVEAYIQYHLQGAPFGANTNNPMTFQILINGVVSYDFLTDPFAPVSNTRSIYLSQGDTVYIKMTAPYYLLAGSYVFVARNIHHNSTSLKIYRTNQGSITLNEAFKNLKIKDFVKECLWFCAVTPIIDPTTRHISFVSLSERLDFRRAVDWTDMYVRRSGETYDTGLAQKNVFRHQYTDPKDNYQDGYLLSNDRNNPDEQILVASKLYAPENINHTFESISDLSFTTKKFTIWSRETKEASDGTVGIEYKGLNERYYFMKLRQSVVSNWLLASETVIGSETVDQVPYADTQGTTYSQIVPARYAPYAGVINNFRCHDIDLAMGLADFLKSDLTRPVYFGQEGMYYMLNRLIYQSGKQAQGEFVRISSAEAIPNPPDITLQALAFNIYLFRIQIPVIDDFDTIEEGDSFAVVNDMVEIPFTGIGPSNMYVEAYISIPAPDAQPSPTIHRLHIKIGNGAGYREYDYSGTGVVFTPADVNNGMTKAITATVQNV